MSPDELPHNPLTVPPEHLPGWGPRRRAEHSKSAAGLLLPNRDPSIGSAGPPQGDNGVRSFLVIKIWCRTLIHSPRLFGERRPTYSSYVLAKSSAPTVWSQHDDEPSGIEIPGEPSGFARVYARSPKAVITLQKTIRTLWSRSNEPIHTSALANGTFRR